MTAMEVRTDWGNVLRYLGLSPDSPESHALVLICDRYGLDPLLGHVSIIATGGHHRPYITRDGMLTIAHRSGKLDGIVVDELRRASDNTGWTAYVSVWRKDMGHPFKYGARCKDTEPQAKSGNGPEMALARAERRALIRAFDIPTSDLVDRIDDEHPGDGGPAAINGEGVAVGPPDMPPETVYDDAVDVEWDPDDPERPF